MQTAHIQYMCKHSRCQLHLPLIPNAKHLSIAAVCDMACQQPWTYVELPRQDLTQGATQDCMYSTLKKKRV